MSGRCPPPVGTAGIPDGNPPSGVASGYVWFDVMAMLLAPYLLAVTDDFRTPAKSLEA